MTTEAGDGLALEEVSRLITVVPDEDGNYVCNRCGADYHLKDERNEQSALCDSCAQEFIEREAPALLRAARDLQAIRAAQREWISVEDDGAFDLLQSHEDGTPFWVCVDSVVQYTPWLRDSELSAWRVDGEIVTVAISHFQPVKSPPPPLRKARA